ncbi:MAG: hypothetical protein JSR66_16955 [Proteobacteria bacterium]|nr:hypothetical protein [Pseudomonadota bacterium]
MYMVAFMYPNKAGGTFNLEHFLEVHLPLGLHQTFKHLALKPVKLVVYSPTWNVGYPQGLLPYIAISSVFFNTRAEAEKFAGLFGFEEAARLLSADFPNYTPGPPDVMMAEVTELTDIDALIAAHGA